MTDTNSMTVASVPSVSGTATPADVANQQGLNQVLSTVSTALNTNSAATISAINAIATAITNSLLGGTAGTTAGAIIISKGSATGVVVKPSVIIVDASGDITGGLANVTQNAGNNSGAANLLFTVSTAAGQIRARLDQTGGVNRWEYGTTSDAESGADAGSNFFINRYHDAGGLIDTPFSINRATGAVAILDSLTVAGVPITGAGGTIAPQVQVITSTQTVTIPANATKCYVVMVGAGAAGGQGGAGSVGCPPACANFFGGAGGSGGGLAKYLSGLTPGLTLSLTIGAAGVPNAGSGGSTILASGTQSITTLTASGGTGGSNSSGSANGANGACGTGTNGDANLVGQPGATINLLQLGSSAPFGLGYGPVLPVGASAAAGLAGLNFGGGGTGGYGHLQNGGAGTTGIAILQWFP